MKKSSSRSDAGSVLIAVSLALILILTLVVALADKILREPIKRGDTGAILKEVYTGIVGNPDLGSFGYLGDTGAYPAGLNDLLTNPGVVGWNGPYRSESRPRPRLNQHGYESECGRDVYRNTSKQCRVSRRQSR